MSQVLKLTPGGSAKLKKGDIVKLSFPEFWVIAIIRHERTSVTTASWKVT